MDSQAPLVNAVSEAPSDARVVFLDRDGVINIDRGYVHKIADFELTPRCAEALRILRDAGFLLAVVTNQSGIAARKYSLADVEHMHDHLRRELALSGVAIDAIALCPHARGEGCDCRKPKTGMARQVAAQLGRPIDFAKSWTIGDKPSDIVFGSALGTRTVLLRSRYWSVGESIWQDASPDLIVETFLQASEKIVESNG